MYLFIYSTHLNCKKSVISEVERSGRKNAVDNQITIRKGREKRLGYPWLNN